MLTGQLFSFKFFVSFFKHWCYISLFMVEGKVEVRIEWLKLERRKSEKMYAFSPMISQGMSWLPFAKSKLNTFITFFPYLHVKKKAKSFLPAAYFSYYEYAWMITIFHSRFINGLLMLSDTSLCNFQITYNTLKESTQNLWCINIIFNDFILFIWSQFIFWDHFVWWEWLNGLPKRFIICNIFSIEITII